MTELPYACSAVKSRHMHCAADLCNPDMTEFGLQARSRRP
jgi:hypothetical protein